MRAEIAAHGRCGRLVEEGEALVDRALLDHRSTLPRQREHLHVPVADPARERGRLLEELLRALEVAFGEERGQPVDELEPGVLRRFRQSLQKPLRVREPPARDRERAAALVVPGQRQRHPRRAERVPGRRVGGVRALAEADRLVELPVPPGGLGERLEIARGQVVLVDLRERGIRRPPRVVGRLSACCLECVENL